MISRFGVITDIHHTDLADTHKLVYSMALARTRRFVEEMNRLQADFIIELGDMVDTLAGNADPLGHLNDIEEIFHQFRGPIYHVVGNHDFDSIDRSTFLARIVNTGVARGASYYSFDHRGLHGIVLDAGYTVCEPHRPFDHQSLDNPFYTWQDAWIPSDELTWLAADLAATRLPTVVFTHQLLHREQTEEHTIKNAEAVRAVLEKSGKVLTVFSGHDHHGDFANRNGILYLVVKSATARDADGDSWCRPEETHFAFVEIEEKSGTTVADGKAFTIAITQKGRRSAFESRPRASGLELRE